MDPLPSSFQQQHLVQLTGAYGDGVNAWSFPATAGIPPAVLGSNPTSFLLCPLPCLWKAIPLFTACNHIGDSVTAAE